MNDKNNCVFCKIVAGDVPSTKIYEDDYTLAFLDIRPVNAGHTVVIPKEHFPAMGQTPDEILATTFVTAKKIMVAIRRATNCDYVALSVIGLDVPHFHIHLIPRHNSDALAHFWPTKSYENDALKQEVADKIKKELE